MGEEKQEGEMEERGTWSHKVEFILSCVGYAVGLGNVWRFPYLCYRNGGGAFLIPYVIMLLVCGLPLFFFELAFGQFASLGPITIWRVNPLFRGVGYAMVSISFMVCIYYNVIIAYALYYLLVSMTSLDNELPWASCGNSWNTPNCIFDPRPNLDNMNDTMKVQSSLDYMDSTCIDQTLGNLSLNRADIDYNFLKNNLSTCNIKYRTASEEYFTNYVLMLNEVEDVSYFGSLSIKLIVVNCLVWLFVFMSLRKGVKSSGKVVYFTALFPYVVLLVLLIRGVTMEGFMRGIEFYVIPKWDRLLDIRVWADAASQIFYSLGPAFGSLITMASFNKYKNNCHRDAIMVALINCGTSVFAGFVIFSVLGYMSYVTNQPVENVADSGPGLVFVAYPDGLSRMPGSAIFSCLFFLMLITLGLDSQFAMGEAVISAIADEFPNTLRRHKPLWTFICCFVMCCFGIPLMLQGGIWILTLMDWYTASYSLMVVSLCELAAVNWIYGIRRFLEDLTMMLGNRPLLYWPIMWTGVTPAVIVFILVMSAIQYTPAYYGDYTFDTWFQGVGWGMVSLPMALILGTMIIQLIRFKSIKKAVTPDPRWGPAHPDNRTGKYAKATDWPPPIDVTHTNDAFVIETEVLPEKVDMKHQPVVVAVNGGQEDQHYF